MQPVLALLVALCAAAQGAPRVAWVVESQAYTQSLRAALNGSASWSLRWCGANGSLCAGQPPEPVSAVVGMADVVDLPRLGESLRLVQSASSYYTPPSEVPAGAIVARYNPDYLEYGVDPIAEWMIAAALQRLYALPARAGAFRRCAFGPESPDGCSAASTATRHNTLGSRTVGILGYGHIGKAVARMAAGFGATVVASNLHGPFEPPPAPLKWLSPSNDRVFREADVIFVTVSGAAGPVVNATGLRMLRDDAHIIEIGHEVIEWQALLAELKRRPSLFASIDNWPKGCWGWPVAQCGRPGEPSFPADAAFAELPNLLASPDMAMRDEIYWLRSAKVVAANLLALVQGKPLAYVVRNATIG